MRLAKLTGLEIEKLEEELKEIRGQIKELKGSSSPSQKRMKILGEELTEIAKKYGDERRIRDHQRRRGVHDRRSDRRRGHGRHHLPLRLHQAHGGFDLPEAATRRTGQQLAEMKEEDFVEHLFVASTHDYVLVFTDDGRCFWLKVHEIPQAGREAKGKPIVNMMDASRDQNVSDRPACAGLAEDAMPVFAARMAR